MTESQRHETEPFEKDRHGGSLEGRGVPIPRRPDGHVDARIKISPLTALGPADLPCSRLPESVSPGEALVL